jgi:hypothetical protein
MAARGAAAGHKFHVNITFVRGNVQLLGAVTSDDGESSGEVGVVPSWAG